MLNNTSLADLLTEQFNAQGKAKGFAFAIFPDVKDFLQEQLIQGVLIAANSDGIPLPAVGGFSSRSYSYYISFAIIDNDLGSRTSAFNKVVTSAISVMQGRSFELDAGHAILTFDVPKSGGGVWIEGGGEGTISQLSLSVVYSQNATTTSDKVWALDGVELPYLDESIDLDVQGATNNIYGLNATQSLPIKQTKYYRFKLPYNNSNPVCGQLQRDMLSGNMNKIYNLSYYDGVAYTADNPYTTAVSLFRTGNSGAVRPAVSNFDVVFTDADDGNSGDIRYEMALIDNPFDDNSVNVRYFDGRASQQEWYADKITSGAPYSAIKAPNLNSLTITQQVYIKPPSCLLGLNSLLTKNYAVIRAVDKPSGNVMYYVYYYVQAANVGADNMILVDLKMDTVQTYYFDPNIKIPNCLIERAHLNRWVDNGDGTVRFDSNSNSLLQIAEDFEMRNKFMATRNRLKFRYDTSKDERLNNWLNDNIIAWIYVFVTNQEFNFMSFINGETIKDTSILVINIDPLAIPNAAISMDMGILCIPVQKTKNGEIFIESKKSGDIGVEVKSTRWWNLGAFKEKNNDTSFYYSQKFSMIAPFAADAYIYGTDYYIDNDNQLHLIGYSSDGNQVVFKNSYFARTSNSSCTAYKLLQHMEGLKTSHITLSHKMSFSKNEIVAQKASEFLEPKLLTNIFNTAKVTNGTAEGFEYDQLRLGTQSISLSYKEALTADATRGFTCYADPVPNSVYISETQKNYTGLVIASDNSIPYANNQLAATLAEQKNYFLAWGANTVSSAIGQLVSKNPLGALTSTTTSAINMAMNVSNLSSSPETIKNANGNAIFNLAISELGVYIEEHKAFDSDIKMAYDFMYKNGYKLNQQRNIKDYINVRYYFNYIQAQIENIQGISISNDARNDIRRRFASGIRFWNSDNIQYDMENYEKWLAT